MSGVRAGAVGITGLLLFVLSAAACGAGVAREPRAHAGAVSIERMTQELVESVTLHTETRWGEVQQKQQQLREQLLSDLDEATADWSPLLEFKVRPDVNKLRQEVNHFNAIDIAFVTNALRELAKQMTLNEVVLSSTDDRERTAAVFGPQVIALKDQFDQTMELPGGESHWLDWALYGTRLPTGATVLETSKLAHAWNVQEFEYDDGTPGLEVTLQWRSKYDYSLPGSDTPKTISVNRWVALNSDSPELSAQYGDWGFRFDATVGGVDECVALEDKVLAQAPSWPTPSTLEDWFYTKPVDEFVDVDAWKEAQPAKSEAEVRASIAERGGC